MTAARIVSRLLLLLGVQLSAGFAITSDAWGQEASARFEEAVGLLNANRPTDASALLHETLATASGLALPAAVRAKAFTTLAMSEWAMYRRPSAEAALVSAIRTDARSFMAFGATWAKQIAGRFRGYPAFCRSRNAV
ncbi:MAG: hypothetical protein FJY97_05905 [candidate division Zixibacteria bacterium]|nr:hypothetical protein [candidate division Zixibacteria bacterium]